MKYFKYIFILFTAVLGSCISFSFDSRENSSWASGDMENLGSFRNGTVQVLSVSAEKSGECLSLENEIRDLLPLLFSEKNFLVVSAPVKADYYADVKIREREYTDRWLTKRSLAAEVRIWSGEFDEILSRPLPLSAGRTLVNGKQSFASSKILSAMLRRAVAGAVKGLPVINMEAGK